MRRILGLGVGAGYCAEPGTVYTRDNFRAIYNHIMNILQLLMNGSTIQRRPP